MISVPPLLSMKYLPVYTGVFSREEIYVERGGESKRKALRLRRINYKQICLSKSAHRSASVYPKYPVQHLSSIQTVG